MLILRLTVSALTIALLADCAGSQMFSAGVTQSAVTAQRSPHSLARSWMLPEAKNDDLLYASDTTENHVYVFSYPQAKLVGTISDVYAPQGICVDAASNIWIVNGYPAELIEYSHGGTSPIATLDTQSFGMGCAIDPSSGDLALVYGRSLISVYPKAQGPELDYTASNFGDLRYDTYDDQGNLYSFGFYGYWPSEQPGLAELPKGSDAIKTIAIEQSIVADGIQWDGKYLAVGGFASNGRPVPIYRMTVSGSTANILSTTLLRNRHETRSQTQFWIQGKTIIQSSDHFRNVSFWHYPKGGDPTNTIKHLGTVVGVAVSLARPHSRTRH